MTEAPEFRTMDDGRRTASSRTWGCHSFATRPQYASPGALPRCGPGLGPAPRAENVLVFPHALNRQ